jgi:hypothetical protein
MRFSSTPGWAVKSKSSIAYDAGSDANRHNPRVPARVDGGDLDAGQLSSTVIGDSRWSRGGVEDGGQRLRRSGQPQVGQVRPQPLIGLRPFVVHWLQRLDAVR